MKSQIYNLSMFGKLKLGKKVKLQTGFWEYVATVAIVLVIIAFIAVPTLRNFAINLFSAMNNWWSGISNKVFQPS